MPQKQAAYVGASAFAHKAGLHASAILKDPTTYEHIEPDCVGNARIIPMSNQAGQSNLRRRLAEAGLEVAKGDAALPRTSVACAQRNHLFGDISGQYVRSKNPEERVVITGMIDELDEPTRRAYAKQAAGVEKKVFLADKHREIADAKTAKSNKLEELKQKKLDAHTKAYADAIDALEVTAMISDCASFRMTGGSSLPRHADAACAACSSSSAPFSSAHR